MVVKVYMNTDRSRSKALKIAAALTGVESASLKGDDKSQIEVIGDRVDAVKLISLLRKSMYAELVSLTYAGGEKKENMKEEPKSEPLLHQVIPKLQRLTLEDSYIAMIASEIFHLIKALGVIGSFNKLDNDFQISSLERFNNLEEFSITGCEIKEIFSTRGDVGNKEAYAGTLSTIRILELRSLQNLNGYLWKQDARVDHILPNLETLQVYNCYKMISLGSSSASFQNLTTLDVWECRAMKYLDTCLAVQSLAKLKKLRIRDCVSMKEIVASDGDEATCEINFNRLKSLELENLPRLESFCSGNHAFGFPRLEEVIASGCPELGIFCKGVINAPLLQSVEYGRDKEHWGGDINSTVQHLHSTKVWCQGVRYLVLSEFSKSIEIWKEKSLDFRKLKDLEVEECNSLKYIFSISIALELVQLEDLKVKNCPTMEYIIKEGAGETAMDTIHLPKLQSIRLESCSDLKSFCMGSITLQCPSLIRIEVHDCRKMHAMACTRPEGGGEKTPFFNDKVLCAGLRTLIVKGCHNLKYLFLPSSIKSFVGLSGLTLVNCKSMEKVIFTDAAEEGITETYLFSKLKVLELIWLPKLGTFCHGDNSDTLFNQKVVFPRLTHLTIQGIGKCQKIWHDEPTNTMDSFYELTHLGVKDCARLLNILPLYMVETLEKLETLRIWECGSLEEIIGADDDDRLDEVTDINSIVFSQLKSLQLDCLPTLSRFCSGKYTLVFPSLEEVIIRQCPKMEIFTKGKLSTPMLHGLKSTEDEYVGLLEGDLNVTLQQLFVEKGILSLEDLEISSINIQRVWKHKLLATHSYAQYLTCLTIEGCHNLNCLFSSTMVKSFVQLKKLKVENCENVENVIFVKGFSREEMMNQKTFRVLEFLLLKDLPKLTRFCHGNFFEFPLLKSLCMQTCPALKAFISDAEGINSEITSPSLFDEKVAFPCLEEVSIIGVGNWRTIWQKHPTNSAVQVEEFLHKDTYYWKAIIEGKVGM